MRMSIRRVAKVTLADTQQQFFVRGTAEYFGEMAEWLKAAPC